MSKCDDIKAKISNAHRDECYEYNLNTILQKSNRLGGRYVGFKVRCWRRLRRKGYLKTEEAVILIACLSDEHRSYRH